MDNADGRSDARLLKLAGGHPEAFATFYRRHERIVLGWLIRRTASPEDVADLTAETFAAAWLARDRYRHGPDGAAPWLLGIARNKLRMSVRKGRTEREARERLGLERTAEDASDLQFVAHLFDDAEGWLADLPEHQRDAVRAYVLDSEDYRSIAARHDIAQPAARQRVSRGLATLRNLLKQQAVKP